MIFLFVSQTFDLKLQALKLAWKSSIRFGSSIFQLAHISFLGQAEL